ncbi:helix-turn-helix domain-containing protein [Pseudoduganella armeniaca]|uniref:Transcriptional regulator n=1 Tax=Pseudoduganella armeniaca TaxID=2072590 RepID=A0A2R4C6A4_9BURK|nr:helix-turn-helix transcriptional regulator [Pseudoduganella armeniaca]AVR95146.1 transcriptional regulator [Pseudoduganella armeniaca]
MIQESLIQLALKALSCNQKELAARLNVSPAQISKWKNGEYMSLDMQKRIRTIIGLGEIDANFVLMAGSVDNAAKWRKLIAFLSERVQFDNDTGYDIEPLNDDIDLLCWKIFDTLKNIGIPIPATPPLADIDMDGVDADDSDRIDEAINNDFYANLIENLLSAFIDVYGFYAAFIADLLWAEELDIFETAAEDIDAHLMHLSATKIEVPRGYETSFSQFCWETKKNYRKWLNIVKSRAIRAGVPLRAELLDLINLNAGALGAKAEVESLGLNSSNLHPDIYMNEILAGIRIIHQVLPLIMKKLGIDEEFKLDTSALYNN